MIILSEDLPNADTIREKAKIMNEKKQKESIDLEKRYFIDVSFNFQNRIISRINEFCDNGKDSVFVMIPDEISTSCIKSIFGYFAKVKKDSLLDEVIRELKNSGYEVSIKRHYPLPLMICYKLKISW
jgi:hypothetical protein